MSSVITAYKNIFEMGRVILYSGTAATDYPLTRLYDRDIGLLFKGNSAADVTIQVEQAVELIANGDFESGDWTGWTQGDAASETTVAKGGYSAKLDAAGSVLTGPTSDSTPVDRTATYKASWWWNVTAYTAGEFQVVINEYSAADGTGFIQGQTLGALSATTAGWIQESATIGPSGADLTFHASTKSIKIIAAKWVTTPTGTAYVDDVSFGLNGYTLASAATEVSRCIVPAGHTLEGAGIFIRYSADHVTYTGAVTPFTQPSASAINKTFTGQTKRWWRFGVTGVTVVPAFSELFLTDDYTWEKNPSRDGAGPEDDVFNTERLETRAGTPRYIVHGSARKRRLYALPRISTAQKTNLLALNDTWAGSKPFWLCDVDGTWIYGELMNKVDAVDVASGVYSATFDFQEIV